jgi:hypothetical protein
MLEALKNLFAKPVDFKTKYEVPEATLSGIVKENREALAKIPNWIDDGAFNASCFKYGVPDFIKDDINKPINSDTTYTDLMVYLSRKHLKALNYLEIGVSVGKNFFQLLEARKDGRFTGFDIEEINPILESKLNFETKEEWDTPKKSIKKVSSSWKTYSFGQATVNYLSADVWDEKSWAKLAGQKFNLVFSDALHTPEAILFEFEMLVKYDLLDKQFIIFWDDLVGKMQNSFYRIIRKYDKAYKIEDIYLMNINGWIGQHEGPHTVGAISNFKL